MITNLNKVRECKRIEKEGNEKMKKMMNKEEKFVYYPTFEACVESEKGGNCNI